MSKATRAPDLILLGATLCLLAIGAVMVYSASFVTAHNESGDPGYYLVRQLLWIWLGGLLMVIAWGMDYRHWQHLSALLLLVSLGLLIMVLVPGFGIRLHGAQRWLALGPLPAMQPSELAKFAVIVYLATWLARKGKQVSHLTYSTIPFGIILALVAGLIMLEPDMGTTFLVVAVAVSIFFVAGANVVHFFLGLLIGGASLTWLATNAAYRIQRVQVFLDPWSDPQSSGWHTIQTLIALGSGGIFGLGLGMSRQKAYWVPNAHTDAIFAIIGEELGLMGTLLILALFAVLAWRGLRIAYLAPDLVGRLMATGITSMLIWQALLNIAVTTNTVPYTGIPLPFVSFGGSSLIVSLMSVGVLLNISSQIVREPESETSGQKESSRPLAAVAHGAARSRPSRAPATARAAVVSARLKSP